jgi:hypothetical protein
MPAAFAVMLLSSFSFTTYHSVVGFSQHQYHLLHRLFLRSDTPSLNQQHPPKIIYNHLKSLVSLSTEPFESSSSRQTDVPLVVSKFFQLEEKEDRENCSTEIFLSNDGTVTIGDTDGPLPLQGSGTWKQTGEKFDMIIKRTFASGQDGSDVGEFKFDVERVYVGYLETVGGSVAIQGSMHLKVRVFGSGMHPRAV